VDLRGKLVVPGLIDLHCHVFHRIGIGADPDRACLARGTTTAVDGGSAGAATLDALRTYVVAGARTRIYAWIHLATHGMVDLRLGDLLQLAYADVDACVRAIEANRDLVVGIKVRLSSYAVGMSALPVLRLVREAADAARVPIMTHIGGAGESLPAVLEWLRPGDVVTHILTGWPNGALDPNGALHSAVREAQGAGVYFDAAQGRMHVSYPVVRALLAQGFLPNGLSTDITVPTFQDPTFHLPGVMNRMLAAGASLGDLVPLVTSNPGRKLGREPWLGTLQVGAPADVSVLQWEEGDFNVRDSFGADAHLDRRLAPYRTYKGGQEIAPQEAPGPA
jgi:dihydroorotase